MKIFGKSKGFTHTPTLASLLCVFKKGYLMRLFSRKSLFFHNISVKQQNTTPKLMCGFTLVEIVIVISIMAVLTAVIYSSFDASKAQSRDQKRISDISTLQLSLEQYFNRYGVYPEHLINADPVKSLVPTYISEIPTDPSTNISYDQNYFPITKNVTPGSIDCISYQLWTTFERNNQYLNSKKGFDSLNTPLPNDMYECGSDHDSAKKDASADPLVYDVMP